MKILKLPIILSVNVLLIVLSLKASGQLTDTLTVSDRYEIQQYIDRADLIEQAFIYNVYAAKKIEALRSDSVRFSNQAHKLETDYIKLQNVAALWYQVEKDYKVKLKKGEFVVKKRYRFRDLLTDVSGVALGFFTAKVL
jgi:hypothetical protein